MLLTPAQIKPKSFESGRNFFLPGVDAPHVYVRAWALGCFYSHVSTQTAIGRALTASVDALAFRHLPPNSARFGYATEGAFFISAQLFTDAVSALRKVRVLIRLWKQPSAQHARKHEAHPPRVNKKSSVSIQTIWVLFELV